MQGAVSRWITSLLPEFMLLCHTGSTIMDPGSHELFALHWLMARNSPSNVHCPRLGQHCHYAIEVHSSVPSYVHSSTYILTSGFCNYATFLFVDMALAATGADLPPELVDRVINSALSLANDSSRTGRFQPITQSWHSIHLPASTGQIDVDHHFSSS